MANDKDITIGEVEKLANKLCMQYSNSKFFAWYCGVIYEFGIKTVEDLMARVGDASKPGHLFTKIVKDWREEKRRSQNKDRLHGQAKN